MFRHFRTSVCRDAHVRIVVSFAGLEAPVEYDDESVSKSESETFSFSSNKANTTVSEYTLPTQPVNIGDTVGG